ncbi:Fur family transcriptional regulator [Aquincola tertiaricarbonis]|uniref:Fur family transcriptional regulator n=1 Tax=Aquincola tertiaricarbonis TaxID=391953 RepID=UPI0012EE8D02|nr:Fur family transcriptional regulator [Aquincola tertiaricarbonis]
MPTTKPARARRDHQPAQQREERLAAYRQRLAEAGMRVTAARLSVMDMVESARAALSHADIEAALPEPLDRVTLYRTLDALVEAGFLSRQVGADRVSRFAAMGASTQAHDEHAHFHCDDCGKVYCLPARTPRVPSVPEGFEVEGVDLHVHGHCAACKPRPRAR